MKYPKLKQLGFSIAFTLAAYPSWAAVVYSVVDLGTLDDISNRSWGTGVNTNNQVTGYSNTNNNTAIHAYRISGSGMLDLGTLGGRNSFGQAINSNGEVAGYSYTNGNAAQHAFIYSSEHLTDLGTLGGRDSFGYGINDSGQVAGWSYTKAANGSLLGGRHAFVTNNGNMTDLGTLGGVNA